MRLAPEMGGGRGAQQRLERGLHARRTKLRSRHSSMSLFQSRWQTIQDNATRRLCGRTSYTDIFPVDTAVRGFESRWEKNSSLLSKRKFVAKNKSGTSVNRPKKKIRCKSRRAAGVGVVRVQHAIKTKNGKTGMNPREDERHYYSIVATTGSQ